MTVLILMEFGKAFDRVKHDILGSILKSADICKESLQLMGSYLTAQIQSVKLVNKTSFAIYVRTEGLQELILGPLLITQYTSQFNKYIKRIIITPMTLRFISLLKPKTWTIQLQ